MLASQLGLDEDLTDLGSYEDPRGRSWSRSSSTLQGLPVDIAITEDGITTMLFLLISTTTDRDFLLDAVLFPALDAVVVAE